MPASVRVRVTHLLLRVLSRARECSLARSAFWHASVSRVSRERLARFVTFLVSGTVQELKYNKDAHVYASAKTCILIISMSISKYTQLRQSKNALD